MNTNPTTPPKFAVGQRVFAVRTERMRFNSASPVAIGTITARAEDAMNQRRYTITPTDVGLTFFESELHATADEAIAAVRALMNHQHKIIEIVEANAIGCIEANK